MTARRYPAEGPFKSADEMWSYTDGGVGLGIKKQQLDKYCNGKTHGYLHRVADSVVCPEEYFWWDDSCTNNAGFLPLKTLARRFRFGLGRSIIPVADAHHATLESEPGSADQPIFVPPIFLRAWHGRACIAFFRRA